MPKGDGPRTHGKNQTPTWKSWNAMLDRGRNPKCKDFSRYGGRGRTVCQRWFSFQNFFDDMGERPPGMSLDRKDNDKGYEPGNCRWATPKQQWANGGGAGLKRVRKLPEHHSDRAPFPSGQSPSD